jgi:hypothetical protein
MKKPQPHKTESVHLRLDKGLARAIDTWRRSKRLLETRPEAIRIILRQALGEHPEDLAA